MIHHTSESAIEWGEDEGVMTWREAVALAESKGDGWRLPTVAELVSRFDYDKGRPCDPSWKRDGHWSSSAYAGDSEYAWFVHLDDGAADELIVKYNFSVRLVRDIPVESINARVVAKVDAIVGPTMQEVEIDGLRRLAALMCVCEAGEVDACVSCRAKRALEAGGEAG